MDVGGPDPGGKQQELKGQEVHGDEEEHPAVGNSLQRRANISGRALLLLCQTAPSHSSFYVFNVSTRVSQSSTSHKSPVAS